ncbi:MAG: UDP-N-acetylglucosamine--N-acetylmuramyl-(pentapeptide) pyrophosphoryl-undecaprenol N-acetylglucosamine transferase, partial [Chloroflexi bacterium]|nr:UDP-N-acetylglucosamine--N-acetylmuramyl-(pentapeptide) pyrophosphoryl-undecaprenol N-acetylglucosamine transferase [Chloroflexota bacterium]
MQEARTSCPRSLRSASCSIFPGRLERWLPLDPRNGGITVRLLICAGGTGGGVYPALTVLQAVRDRAEVLWVGGEGGMEAALVRRAGVPFQSIPAGGVHGVGAAHLPGNLWRLLRGYFAARRILRVFNPHVIFYTGGYLAVPMAAAAWRYPTLLYVPDIEPGLALKTI